MVQPSCGQLADSHLSSGMGRPFLDASSSRDCIVLPVPAVKIQGNPSYSPGKTSPLHVNREGPQCCEKVRWLQMTSNSLELGTLPLPCLGADARLIWTE